MTLQLCFMLCFSINCIKILTIMKQLFTFFFALLISSSVYSQVTMTDTVVFSNFPKDGATHNLINPIVNNSPNSVTVTWSKTSDSLLSGLTGMAICDPNVCYVYNSNSHSFTMLPGDSSIFYVDMMAITSAANGSSYVTISTNFGDMVFEFQTNSSSTCNAGFYIYEDSLAAPHTYIGVNTSTGTNLTYDWSWGDGTANSSGQFPSHTYASAGTYNICLTVSDGLGCVDSFCSSELINKTLADMYSITFQNPNSVSEINADYISIYPNPAHDFVGFKTNSSQTLKVDFMELSGKLILSTFITNGKSSIDISSFAKGLYSIKLSDENGVTHYSKLLKQ